MGTTFPATNGSCPTSTVCSSHKSVSSASATTSPRTTTSTNLPPKPAKAILPVSSRTTILKLPTGELNFNWLLIPHKQAASSKIVLTFSSSSLDQNQFRPTKLSKTWASEDDEGTSSRHFPLSSTTSRQLFWR